MMIAISTQNRPIAVSTGFAIPVNFDLLWQRKLWVFLATVSALVAGLGYLAVTDPTYEVEARVLVENRGLSATGGLEKTTRYREFLATQGEILVSERIIAPATQSTPQWQQLGTEEQQGLVRQALEDFEVATVVNTDVLRLRFRGEDADFAVNLINGVLSEYASHIRKDDKDRFGGMLHSLAKSEQDLREELTQKGQALARCRSKNGLVGTGRDMVHVQLSSLNNLTSRLADVRRNRLELQLKLGSLKSDAQPGGVALVSHEVADTANSSFPELRNNASNEPTEARGAYDVVRQQWQAKSALDEASVRFGPKHPDYQAAKERAEEWEKFTTQHNTSLLRMLENELAAAREAEDELQKLVDAEYKKIKQVDQELLEEQQLTGEIARIEAAHAIAIERLRDYRLTDAHIEQGKSSTNIVVLSHPKKPEEPIWPQPIPFMGICGLFGLILSSLAALYL